MSDMTHTERVMAVIEGTCPDYPPVSFWHHFPPQCHNGSAAVDAHLKHASRFDLDFLKVMNDNPYPTTREIRSASDLRGIPVLEGTEGGYADQLNLIRSLAGEVSGSLLLVTTLFNSWTVLRRIVVPRKRVGQASPPTLDAKPAAPDLRLSELLAEDRGAVEQALDAVASSQANFAAQCVEAGADGVFLSVRDDWTDNDANGHDTYEALVRRGDLRILAAAGGARFNMLHVCGVARNFGAFAQYPVQAINWADRAAGPGIAEVVDQISPAVCGGVDNLATLPRGTPEEVAAETRDALRQAGDRPMMIGAGCTYDPNLVPARNLDAMVQATRAGCDPGK